MIPPAQRFELDVLQIGEGSNLGKQTVETLAGPLWLSYLRVGAWHMNCFKPRMSSNAINQGLDIGIEQKCQGQLSYVRTTFWCGWCHGWLSLSSTWSCKEMNEKSLKMRLRKKESTINLAWAVGLTRLEDVLKSHPTELSKFVNCWVAWAINLYSVQQGSIGRPISEWEGANSHLKPRMKLRNFNLCNSSWSPVMTIGRSCNKTFQIVDRSFIAHTVRIADYYSISSEPNHVSTNLSGNPSYRIYLD